jgi:hypothetical protein
MQTDPAEEWRRLTRLYSEMGDIEIEDLADQIDNLTSTAQDVLREELKKRGLTNAHEESAGSFRPASSQRLANVNWETATYRERFGSQPDEDDGSHHYTWKVPLCDCETTIEVRHIAAMLQRAGIDTWIQAAGGSGRGGPRILVAADQLDQAQLIAAQPVPQDILDEEKELETAPAYELPVCPQCGAPDPTLESVEPTNTWLCESCDHTWSDPMPENSAQEQTPSGT